LRRRIRGTSGVKRAAGLPVRHKDHDQDQEPPLANEPNKSAATGNKAATAAGTAAVKVASASGVEGSAMPLWLGALTGLVLLGTGMYGVYKGPAAAVTAPVAAVVAPAAEMAKVAPGAEVPVAEVKMDAGKVDAGAAALAAGSASATVAVAADTVKDMAKDAVNTAETKVAAVTDAAKDMAKDAVKTAETKVAAVTDAAKDLAKDAVKTAETKVAAATDVAKDMAKDAVKTAETKVAAVTPPANAPKPDVAVADLMAPGALKDNVLGEANAPITIVEYASTTCPHCRDFHKQVLPELKKKYIDTGKAKLIFRAFTLNDLDLAVSMLARCTGEVRYYAFLGAMYEKQGEWATNDGTALNKIRAMAQQAGFTDETFNACLKDDKLLKDLQDVKTTADTKFGVDSTPTIFVNGVKAKGNELKDVEDLIKALGLG
jgi:protein-disulfide isomerase